MHEAIYKWIIISVVLAFLILLSFLIIKIVKHEKNQNNAIKDIYDKLSRLSVEIRKNNIEERIIWGGGAELLSDR